MLSLILNNRCNFLRRKLPCTRPDHYWLFKKIKDRMIGISIDEIAKIRIDLCNRQRITFKIQAFINNSKLEIFFLCNINQLLQAAVKLFRTLPAHDKTVDPGI